MTVANRRCWFPTWMFRRVINSGCGLISADYRLMPPASGHDINILEDIYDILRSPVGDLDRHLSSLCKVELSTVIITGSGSEDSMLHAMPKPVVVISMHGMGGDVLIPQYLSIKTEPFLMG